MMQNEPEPRPGHGRVREFVEHFTVWMKEIADVRHNPTVASSLVDLMKARLAADLDRFVEQELRLRAFECRAPEAEQFLKLVEKAG